MSFSFISGYYVLNLRSIAESCELHYQSPSKNPSAWLTFPAVDLKFRVLIDNAYSFNGVSDTSSARTAALRSNHVDIVRSERCSYLLVQFSQETARFVSCTPSETSGIAGLGKAIRAGASAIEAVLRQDHTTVFVLSYVRVILPL